MADYTITLDANPQQVLQAFRQIEQSAQSTGQVIGQRFGEGVRKFSTESLAGLQAELNRLQQRQLTVGVNTAAFNQLGQRINEVRAQLDAASRKQLSIGVDDRSVTALQSRLQDLQGELNRVAIGSQRFRELQGSIESTQRELAKASESTDGFRLLDGVVQGVAFSLSNAVVNAAGAAFQALQSVVMQYAKLNTELRQAAAADGGAGAYDKIASSVDRVGIEAAGTTQDVAKLATELIRGGMTADQVNASLGAIVRGAEATGTAYASMGSNVSAALKGFGLPASEATRVVDALVTGANASATSVEGMGMAFKYSAPVAKILGVSIEDLGVAVGLLTNAGIDASEAGVTLRNGLSKLASAAPQAAGSTQKLSGQAAEAARAMKTLGINIYNADGTLKPMRETLLSLKGAFDKLGPSAKIRLAASMFGGEDDGTKWLALLNQSNEEIIKMANTMANTRGATDKARDAMQGFELLTKQVDGTVGSLGNVLGKAAVGALTPFVNVANSALGIISGMPGPVKDTAAAFILLTGGVITATAATVIYQRVMASAIGQKALAEVVAFAGAFRETLSKGISTAAARLPALIGGVANLALRMGYLIIAFKTFEAITGGSSRVGQGFEDRLKETQKALDTIVPAAGKASKALTGAVKVDGAEQFRKDMFGLLNFVDNFSKAADLNTIAKQTEQLQRAFTGVQGAAIATLQALKGATALTGDQRKDIADRIAALKVIKDQATSQAQAYKDLASEYRSAGKEFEAGVADRNAKVMQVEADNAARLSAGLQDVAAKTETKNALTSESLSLADQLAIATRNRIQAEQDISGLSARLTVGQQLLAVSQAIGEADQARFSISKSIMEFELKQAQARGAGEGELEAIRLRVAANDRAALTARFQSLVREQEAQRALLAMEQEKAKISAQNAVSDARKERLDAEISLSKAATEEERRKISLQIEGIDAQIIGRRRELDALNATQPLQAREAEIKAQSARAGLQAQAAQDGFRIAANGTLQPLNRAAQATQRIAELTKTARDVQITLNQQRIANADKLAGALQSAGSLEQSRFSVARAGLEYELQKAQERGASEQEIASIKQRITEQDRAALDAKYLQLQREQQLELVILSIKQQQQQLEAQQAVRTSEIDLRMAQSELQAAVKSGDKIAIDKANFLVQKQAILLDGEREKLALLVQGQELERASVLLQQNAADNAIRAEQASKGFAIAPEDILSANAAFETLNAAAANVSKLNLAGQFDAVASNTAQAAAAAQEFYGWLERASRLPQARWAGGPVEAGGEYRINELGQEAFLSAGRLSMIDAPANSIWRAPSEGVVIPAGITARLQGRTQATISPGGISGGTAELAIEVGKLRQEVGNLARRDWSVHVTQRTGPTGSQVMRTLLR